MKKIAVQILEKLETAGYEAYLVGGCVRDLYLGQVPKDYDICTNALPAQIMHIFSHTVPTGIQHGTVTVIEEKLPFEVTTFRVEAEYRDHRRPSAVSFVSQLKEDLARRDFTMNAMAQDRHGKIYDYFHGRKAIQEGEIRSVGEPSKRFTEDALRMLRAVRFAAQFQFSLDAELIIAVQECKKTMKHLSVERVVLELEKIWQTGHPSISFRLLDQLDLLTDFPVFSAWDWQELKEHQLEIFDWVEDRIVHWAYLFYLGRISVETVAETCRMLTLSGHDRRQISDCVAGAAMWQEEMSSTQVKRMLLQAGLTTMIRAYQLSQMMRREQPKVTMIKQIRTWWQQMTVKKAMDLAISGHDLLLHTGKQPGPWVGELLDQLLIRVALGELPNQKQILLKEGRKFGAANS